jgi:hypothetical protein
MAPVTFEDSPAGGGTTPRVCWIYEEHEEREHESDNNVEVIDADSIGDEEVSDYGGDPEDAEATILVLEDRHCRVVYTPYKGTVNRVCGRVCTGPGSCQRRMPGPHWTLRSNPSKRAPPGPYQSLPPSRAGGEPDGKQGTLLSAVEYLGTRKARRVANLAYAANWRKRVPRSSLDSATTNARRKRRSCLSARAQTDRRRTDRLSPRRVDGPPFGQTGGSRDQRNPA